MLIGEVARLSGVSARMLRHYESLGLVAPSGRTTAGYRVYSADDLRRLLYIESLRSLGLSLGDIRHVLEDPGFTPSALIDELIAATTDRIAREEKLLSRLEQVRSASPADWTDVLPTIALLRGLDSEDASRRQRAALASSLGVTAPARLLVEALLAESDPNVAGALRWALARSDENGLDALRPALEAPSPEVRRRAVDAIADITSDETTTLLIEALDDSDGAVRARAALALGVRGESQSVPSLIAMVVDGTNDVEASETLGTLALRHGLTDRITQAVTGQLEHAGVDEPARVRLVHTLAELPGPAANHALTELAQDAQQRVALTARAILLSSPVVDGQDV
ncbi:HEAT repeat domain-containing protein [Phytoactinopolyspora mesophila]|uniref:MerR family transcriptional regulator n=1 Tax=Phytoactinopolyspora mesophila TaxID=2650750 RepID=A0A7K3M0L5_9ACTN|nr:HEAT repeat domain-containing protein [Phytoactinopolyspora mesophila]NDL56819.1 MerR family transcriptional regulator [Phytoactinopolyspora mesophila]